MDWLDTESAALSAERPVEKPGEERHEVGASQGDKQHNQAHKPCLAPLYPPLLYRHGFWLFLQSHFAVCSVLFLNFSNPFQKLYHPPPPPPFPTTHKPPTP